MISVYTKKTEIELTNRRLEQMAKYNKIIQYGRQNPTWFIEEIFRVPLLDFQKLVIMNSWAAERVCWVCSRNTGKTFLAALYMMSRSTLFPYYQINLLNVSARQAQDTFLKMENIAKKQVASIIGSSDVFYNEVSRSQANTDGFLHREQTYTCTLYNGSTITSLVGTPKTIVGKRSNLNIYDEAGKIPHELFALTEPFTTQDADFKTGGNIDLTLLPKSLPNQCLYMSSAEDVNSYLYTVYKDCAKSMMMGRRDKYVVDISCEIPINPTMGGKPYAPLLKRSVVDAAMKINEPKALREYYNLFDVTGGADAAITRDVIVRNEYRYLPVLGYERKEGVHYGIFYDPALQRDNSFVLIAEYWKDEEKGWMCRIINGKTLLHRLPSGERKMLRSTEQLQEIKDLMVDYNGPDSKDWENLHIFIDPGAGGAGRTYTDNLLEDWVGKDGKLHYGIIDENDATYKELVYKFPHAVKGVLQLLEATKYKTEMFGEGIEMINQDLVMFPPPMPGNGVLQLDDREVVLTQDEIRALIEIDLAKEEMVSIKKLKTSAGNVKYDLPPSKELGSKKIGDDRAYCLAAATHYLSQLRRKDQYDKKNTDMDFSVLYNNKTGSQRKNSLSPFSGRNPFQGRNPFVRR